MARIRTIKPSFFCDEDIAELPLTAAFTFVGLWTHVDDEGRAIDNAKLVKAAVWPLRDDHSAEAVERDLETLSGHHVCRYVGSDGRRYLHVIHWEHQKISHPLPSSIPKCPAHEGGEVPPQDDSGKFPEPSGKLPEPSGKFPEPSGRLPEIFRPDREKERDREGDREEEEEEEAGRDVDLVAASGGSFASSGALGTFPAFWDRYPPRNGKKLDRAKAQAVWQRLPRSDQTRALIAVGHYAASCAAGRSLAKDAHRWLRDRSWVDWDTPDAPPAPVLGAPPTLVRKSRNMAVIDAVFAEVSA